METLIQMAKCHYFNLGNIPPRKVMSKTLLFQDVIPLRLLDFNNLSAP